MFKMHFEAQTRHNSPDYEFGSIELTKEEYFKLPVLSAEIFKDEKCRFHSGDMADQVRRPENRYPAIHISHPDWKLAPASENSGGYLDDSISWSFICVEPDEDLWIGFESWDSTTLEDVYGSTVDVSYPGHGPTHRLGEDCMEIVHRYYPKS